MKKYIYKVCLIVKANLPVVIVIVMVMVIVIKCERECEYEGACQRHAEYTHS